MNPIETAESGTRAYLARFLGCDITDLDVKLRSLANETDDQRAARIQRTETIIDEIQANLKSGAREALHAAVDDLYDSETGLPV